jgi:hypothetical protein
MMLFIDQYYEVLFCSTEVLINSSFFINLNLLKISVRSEEYQNIYNWNHWSISILLRDIGKITFRINPSFRTPIAVVCYDLWIQRKVIMFVTVSLSILSRTPCHYQFIPSGDNESRSLWSPGLHQAQQGASHSERLVSLLGFSCSSFDDLLYTNTYEHPQ